MKVKEWLGDYTCTISLCGGKWWWRNEDKHYFSN